MFEASVPLPLFMAGIMEAFVFAYLSGQRQEPPVKIRQSSNEGPWQNARHVAQ